MVADGRRFALLMAARDSDYVKQAHGGYFNVFLRALGEEGETWDVYMIIDGEFPAENEVEGYDGFVISGSPFDAYGDDPWVLHLCHLLRTLQSMEKKILGICFGHQVLSRALGGRVEKSRTGWDIGVRRVTIVKELVTPCKFLGGDDGLASIPPSLCIIECHQDVVLEVPDEAQVIAFSQKTGVEMFAIGDHVLGIQGHPEYNKDILNHLIDRLCSNGSIEEELAERVRSELHMAEPDSKNWERICRNFLKGRRS